MAKVPQSEEAYILAENIRRYEAILAQAEIKPDRIETVRKLKAEALVRLRVLQRGSEGGDLD